MKFISGLHIDYPSTIIGLLTILLMIFYPKSWGKTFPSFIVGYLAVNFSSPCPKTRYSFSRKNSNHPYSPSSSTFDWIESSRHENSPYPSHKHYRTWNDRKSPCGASAGRATNHPMDNNQELVAQGIGNIFIPFFEEFQQQPQLLEQV